MDYVRSSGSRRIYNTYIFQSESNWRYENSNQRPSVQYPRSITTDWPGVPGNVDAFVHYSDFSLTTLTYIDEYFFFQGTQR